MRLKGDNARENYLARCLPHTVNFISAAARDVLVKLFKEKLYLSRASRKVFQVEVSLYLGQDR